MPSSAPREWVLLTWMAGGSDSVWILKPQDTRALSMINAPTIRLSFRVHFIPLNGPDNDPEVRVLLVETASAQTIYEASGSWAQCDGCMDLMVLRGGQGVSHEEIAAAQQLRWDVYRRN